MINKNLILQLALATLVGMPMVAVIIDRLSDTVDLASALVGYSPWWQQILYGIVSGFVIAFIAQWIISLPIMEKVNARYSNMLGRFELSLSEILIVSVCAGVGEEILFRGAMQPLLGIFLTAMIFVAIHGYINPNNWRLSIYGFYMVLAMIGIGLMASQIGLVAAIIAHTVIDVYLLLKLQDNAGQIPVDENANLFDNYTEDQSEQDY
jgi:uncharacterized protein